MEVTRHATIHRSPSTDQGTFGRMVLDDGTEFHSLELPWRDNEHDYSCIEPGKYLCEWVQSPKHGECYLVTGTPGRSAVEIHAANYAGDVKKGYRSDLLGCIALGKTVGPLHIPGPMQQQLCVLASKVAIAEFEAKMAKQPFYLTIEG